ISYASADEEKAYRLCQLLEAKGIDCWIAPRNINPGADYRVAILQAIEYARTTLLLLSAQANASIHVASEVERAIAKGKKVIPVRLENVQPSQALELHLGARQWLDARQLS